MVRFTNAAYELQISRTLENSGALEYSGRRVIDEEGVCSIEKKCLMETNRLRILPAAKLPRPAGVHWTGEEYPSWIS